VESGLQRAAEQFKRASGNEIKMQFNTAPQLAKRMAGGEVADILIAPPAILDEQAKNGKISMQGRLTLGRVGAGVVVRSDAPSPEIGTTEALKRAMLSADSIVYNTASSGLYLENLFERIGVAEQIKAKTTRYPTGEDVMNHIIKGRGNELGFGAITEIKLFEPKGLMVGPLPPDIQNYTSYGAGAHKRCSFCGCGESISHISRHAGGETDFRRSGDRIGWPMSAFGTKRSS
jgi:molybdate transport system substrate-binding protein